MSFKDNHKILKRIFISIVGFLFGYLLSFCIKTKYKQKNVNSTVTSQVIDTIQSNCFKLDTNQNHLVEVILISIKNHPEKWNIEYSSEKGSSLQIQQYIYEDWLVIQKYCGQTDKYIILKPTKLFLTDDEGMIIDNAFIKSRIKYENSMKNNIEKRLRIIK